MRSGWREESSEGGAMERGKEGLMGSSECRGWGYEGGEEKGRGEGC